MPTHLSKLRLIAYTRQGKKCYYCNAPMWIGTPDEFVRQYHLRLEKARLFQATAEHLHARQDGGRDSRSNIVAACWYCNSHRHRCKFPLCAEAYKEFVSEQKSQGRWHSPAGS